MVQIIIAIVALGIVFLLGFATVGFGIYCIHDGNRDLGVLGIGVIILGGVIIILSTIGLIQLFSTLQETTVTVISKGCVESIVCEQNFQGEKVDSSKTYYILIEDGNKVIVSEEVWKNIDNEYTYVPAKAEYIEED
jgi:hypothetical protein